MDGDLCPLPALLDLAEQFNCMLLVDEAHATGIMGATGAGCVEHFGCTGRQLIQVGTLSKALGSLGGYVAGSAALIDFLRNRAASWIYTTALSPADTAAALAAVKIVNQEPERARTLWQNVNQLKQLITQELPHFKLLPTESPILCLHMESVAEALIVGQQLKTSGIFCPSGSSSNCTYKSDSTLNHGNP
jgi:8-amino-7-oxononanoate synthase